MGFKDLKIRSKLAIGFGLLIGLSLALGAVAITNMGKIKAKTGFMANEFAPEVEISNNIERNAYMAMNADLAYSETGDERYLEQLYSSLTEVKKSIESGFHLAARAQQLDSLNLLLKEADMAVRDYESVVGETATLNKKVYSLRAEMDSAAAIYVATCNEFVKTQEKLIARDIALGVPAYDRLKLMGLMSNTIVTSYQVIELCLKGQINNDMSILKAVLKKHANKDDRQSASELRKAARTAADRQTIDAIDLLADRYLNALANYVRVWDAKASAEERKEQLANVFLAKAKASALAGVAGTKNLASESINLVSSSTLVVMVGLLFAVILGFIFAVVITRSITKPVFAGMTFAKSLSEGDLTARVDINQKDEMGALTSALTDMVTRLRGVLSDVISHADYISNASSQMSHVSQQLSEGSSEQAASSEEVAASMEEMSGSIQNNTANARETEKIANKVAAEATKGSQAVNETVSSMRTIVDKVSIIGEIARQTNILALNAAVEAARAGEHGKGFAVVAAEVRKLAERSHYAALEIDELSKKSVIVAEESGKLLAEIVPQIRRTAELVKEITICSTEQEASSRQVNAALQQLNQIVQSTAASAEEMAGSSQELSGNSERMKELVAFFKMKKRDDTTAAAQKVSQAGKKQGTQFSSVSKGYNITRETKGARVKLKEQEAETVEQL